MGLDDFIPSETWDTWPKSAEISEVFKEAIKRWSAWVKRVQKDEKKARKFDNLLAWFLVELIRDKSYDFLHEWIFSSLDDWYPSNFLIWVISLIYLPISDKIRELNWKTKVLFNYEMTQELLEFNDNNLDEAIKHRINDWMDDILDIIMHDYSSIQIKKLLELHSQNQTKSIFSLTSKIFVFYFRHINIEISHRKALSYVEFILNEIFKKIKNIEIQDI